MNDTYGTDFPETQRFTTQGQYVPSLLGKGKMSKSVNDSYIGLIDDKKTIEKKVAKIPTDTGKGTAIPTEGGVAALLTFVELFQGKEKREEYAEQYTDKGIRYGDLKKELSASIFDHLQPIQEKRRKLESTPKYVEEVIQHGAKEARQIASQTLSEVRQKMGLV